MIRSSVSASGHRQSFALRHAASSAVLTILLGASVSLLPSAASETLDATVMAAVTAARGTSSCEPLRADPLARDAAAEINESTDKWVNFDARAQPAPEALPVLKDLGYVGSKAIAIYGASPDFGSAVKALVLQGFRAIPDCAYTAAGANTLWNDSKQTYFVTVVLAG